MLNHPNNLAMKDSYLTTEGDDEYLNIVMDYFPDNLYQLVKKKEVSSIHTKLYAYQLLRGLNYLTMLSIAHRDIKPQNILVDKHKNLVVITDFGSAKQLVKGSLLVIQVKPTSHTSAQDATGPPNLSLGPPTTRLRSTCGQLAAS